MIRLILLSLSLLCMAGCYRSQPATGYPGQPDSDPVWSSYHMHGPMPRAYWYSHMRGRWLPSGPLPTADDIARAPCPVVIAKGTAAHYDHDQHKIYLDTTDTLPILWHESRHCIDRTNGITDARELERRSMIAEMGGNP